MRAAEIVAGGADGHGDAAPAREPVRDVGDQRREGAGAADADQPNWRARTAMRFGAKPEAMKPRPSASVDDDQRRRRCRSGRRGRRWRRRRCQSRSCPACRAARRRRGRRRNRPAPPAAPPRRTTCRRCRWCRSAPRRQGAARRRRIPPCRCRCRLFVQRQPWARDNPWFPLPGSSARCRITGQQLCASNAYDTVRRHGPLRGAYARSGATRWRRRSRFSAMHSASAAP